MFNKEQYTEYEEYCPIVTRYLSGRPRNVGNTRGNYVVRRPGPLKPNQFALRYEAGMYQDQKYRHGWGFLPDHNGKAGPPFDRVYTWPHNHVWLDEGQGNY